MLKSYCDLHLLSCSIPIYKSNDFSIREKRWILSRWLRQKPVDLDLQCFQKRITSFWLPYGFHLCYFCLVLLCFHVRLFVVALWSPAGKGVTSWLSFMMSNCDVVIFPLVSIPDLALFLTSNNDNHFEAMLTFF